ncbi:RidA family protein [Mesobacterium pallidum]|uniref:RidA family protein n=1 Tax=Mesobacterium pallidum TaxID=2872037 RepID=UPI001EE2767D|nr:RidA family protein [Mesobacterium pallidum]
MGELREVTAPGIPAAVPGLFSNAVVCDGVVYVSGQHAGGSEGLAEMTMYDQAREALRRVQALVEAAGSDITRVTKITVLVIDMSQRAEVTRARKEVFTGPLPAATMAEVSGFVDPALMVEIEAIAHL